MLDRAADAVPCAVGAAVQAGQRAHIGIEPHDQPVGAARRPRLVHAHRLDGAALQRLEEAAPRRQRRCDPLVGRHLGEHVAAIVVLLQHELDQPVARRKHRQPGAAAGGGRQPGRIARQMIDRNRALAGPSKASSRCRQLSLTIDAVARGQECRTGKAMSAATCRRRPPAGRRFHSDPEAPFRIRSAAQADALRSADPLVSHSAPSAAKASAVMQPNPRAEGCCSPSTSSTPDSRPTAISPAGEAASAVTGEPKF